VRILLFGATGLAGGGVLRACIDSPEVTEVRSVQRRSSGISAAKLHEIIHDDCLDHSVIAEQFSVVDACFSCPGRFTI